MFDRLPCVVGGIICLHIDGSSVVVAGGEVLVVVTILAVSYVDHCFARHDVLLISIGLFNTLYCSVDPRSLLAPVVPDPLHDTA